MEDPELTYEENSEESEIASDEEEATDDADSGIDYDERDDDDSANTNAGDERFGGAPPKKKARLSKTGLYKPPTSDEINQLKETENLFQSSLLRMQVGVASLYSQSHRLSHRLTRMHSRRMRTGGVSVRRTPCGQTDTCENSLRKLRLRAVEIGF